MTTATDDDLSLTVTRLIPAAPERVFGAWLDPKMLLRFMHGGPDVTCTGAETDPRVGGAFRIVMVSGGKDIPHTGTYLEITPHRRLSFTWNSPFAGPGSTVSLDFAPEGAGTRLTLTHVKFATPEIRDGHHRGWTAILAALASAMG
ncbi:MAG: SRPBCC domain-containing protein [Proteobacteria bacterium]|nr:SRPBCC domain-containing protein [Pseudomonadota bacterium]MBS0573818.1 SRPBCC domain-containing protein [Pseudomonadota bacterium]